jgi:hypothetical protein
MTKRGVSLGGVFIGENKKRPKNTSRAVTDFTGRMPMSTMRGLYANTTHPYTLLHPQETIMIEEINKFH